MWKLNDPCLILNKFCTAYVFSFKFTCLNKLFEQDCTQYRRPRLRNIDRIITPICLQVNLCKSPVSLLLSKLSIDGVRWLLRLRSALHKPRALSAYITHNFVSILVGGFSSRCARPTMLYSISSIYHPAVQASIDLAHLPPVGYMKPTVTKLPSYNVVDCLNYCVGPKRYFCRMIIVISVHSVVSTRITWIFFLVSMKPLKICFQVPDGENRCDRRVVLIRTCPVAMRCWRREKSTRWLRVLQG